MALTAAHAHYDAVVDGINWQTVLEGPPIGTSYLLNRINLCNMGWGAIWIILELYSSEINVKVGLFMHFNTPGFATYEFPATGKDGPIVMESGWDLRVYSNTLVVGGAVVDVDYGIDDGYGDHPSDYHASRERFDAAAGHCARPLVDAAPENKVRAVKSVVVNNTDGITHNYWTFTTDVGGADPGFLWNLGNLTLGVTGYLPYRTGGISIESDRELRMQKGTADSASFSRMYASYLIAGGVEGVGPSDTGPWTRSQQVAQRRCVAFDGALDRLMTHPTAATTIGIANHWTILVWCNKAGTSPDIEHILMLGALADNGAIHLSCNTDPLEGGPYAPFEIEVIDQGGTSKKKYRWGGTLSTGIWECVGVTFDGSATDADGDKKLQCWKNGVKYDLTVDRATDDAIGALVDTNRYLGLGGSPEPTGTNTDGFPGSIWQAAVWSRVVSDEELVYLSSVYHAHNTLRESHGPYVAGVDLEHYWRPGIYYEGGFGVDFGLGSDTAQLSFEESVDNNNIDMDYPGKELF